MKQFQLFILFLSLPLFCNQSVNAQAAGDLPANAVAGKCYAKCMIPDQYETVTEEVLLKEASTRIEIVPAVYEDVEEQVLVKEAYKVLNIVPATFNTVTEELLVKEAASRLEYVPPTFETVTEQILVQPAATKWIKGKADKTCLNSKNPEDCKVWCLEEIPAQYKTVTRQVLKSPANTTEIPIPAEYKTITKAVVQSPAQTTENEIPAEYRTVTKKVLAQPATTKEVVIPAEYSTVSTRKLVKEGGFTQWVEILCPSRMPSKIAEIQQALKARGYDPGPIDNVMGTQTKNALIKYQQDNNLPSGQLNIETLRSLGLQF